MSFAEKWQNLISDTPKSIDNIDKKNPKKLFVNTVNQNKESENKSKPKKKVLVFRKPIDNIDKNTNSSLESKRWLFKKLLNKVGAYIRHDQDGPALVFDPPLDGEKVDPNRWSRALELENIFFEMF